MLLGFFLFLEVGNFFRRNFCRSEKTSHLPVKILSDGISDGHNPLESVGNWNKISNERFSVGKTIRNSLFRRKSGKSLLEIPSVWRNIFVRLIEWIWFGPWFKVLTCLFPAWTRWTRKLDWDQLLFKKKINVRAFVQTPAHFGCS